MAKKSIIDKIAGKERVAADHAAAQSIVEIEVEKERLKREDQRKRESLIAQCHEVIGRIQGLNLVSKFADVSNLMWLRDVKSQKIYKELPNIGTWQKFCDYIGLSRQKVDEDLLNLQTFGEAFLADVSSFRVGYRELRKLRQIANNGDIVIDAEFVTIGEERIPLASDYAEDLQAAIESLLEGKNKEIEEKTATIAAKDKVLKDKENVLNLQAKELAVLEGRAEAKGLTAEEDAICQDLDNSRTIIDGFFMKYDPEKNPLPENATVRMRAKLMHTLDYFKRVVDATFDTASEMYGDPEIDDDWVPPHLRARTDEAAEA